MKRVIRSLVFETNSSTSHSIIILSKENLKRWEEDPELYVAKDIWEYTWRDCEIKPEKGKLYTEAEILDMLQQRDKLSDSEWENIDELIRDEGFITCSQWDDQELEFDVEEFTSPSGDEMVAMCAYGYE